jgi:hypothetical protein
MDGEYTCTDSRQYKILLLKKESAFLFFLKNKIKKCDTFEIELFLVALSFLIKVYASYFRQMK